MEEQRRSTLITGGASGIGRAAVELFLARGDNVVATDLNPDSLQALKGDLQDHFDEGRLRTIRIDVSNESDVAAAISEAAAEFGGLDCLINNAGVGGAFGAITDMQVEDWDYTFDVLARGVFLGIKHGARQMKAQGTGGSIVNTASPSAGMGGMGRLSYSSAKASVVTMTRMAAVELAPFRIRVNAVNPGLVKTPLVGSADLSEGSPLRTALPWPDYGLPIDVARVMHFLCGEDAGYVTGVTIDVDGGLVAAGARLGFEKPPAEPGVSFGTTGRSAIVREKL